MFLYLYLYLNSGDGIESTRGLIHVFHEEATVLGVDFYAILMESV